MRVKTRWPIQPHGLLTQLHAPGDTHGTVNNPARPAFPTDQIPPRPALPAQKGPSFPFLCRGSALSPDAEVVQVHDWL